MKWPSSLTFNVLFVAYFFVCGAINTYTYWSYFSMDPMIYLDYSDVAKYSFRPIISNFPKTFFILLSLLVVNYMARGTIWEDDNKKRERTIILLIAIILVLCLTLYMVPQGEVFIWIPITILSQHLVKLIDNKFLSGHLSYIGSTLVFAIFMLPVLAFSDGKSRAEGIKNNQQYTYIHNIDVGDSLTNLLLKNRQYLGELNGKIFIRSRVTNTISILSDSEVKILELRNYESQKK